MGRRISSNNEEVPYIKHVAELNGPKVTIRVNCPFHQNEACIHIMDHGFATYEAALRFLQDDARNIVDKEARDEAVS